MSARRAAIVSGLVFVAVLAVGAQPTDVIWDVSQALRDSDRRAILDLARQAGILMAERVSDDDRPSPCPRVRVHSRPRVDGNRVATISAGIARNRPECRPAQTARQGSSDIRFSGDWFVAIGAYNPRTAEEWRVRDRTWHVDVRLASDVSFAVAQTVVLAFRHQTIVDLQPTAGRRPLSAIHPGAILSIVRDQGIVGVITVVPAKRDCYWVRTGTAWGGQILVVSLRDGRVELEGVMDWTA